MLAVVLMLVVSLAFVMNIPRGSYYIFLLYTAASVGIDKLFHSKPFPVPPKENLELQETPPLLIKLISLQKKGGGGS